MEHSLAGLLMMMLFVVVALLIAMIFSGLAGLLLSIGFTHTRLTKRSRGPDLPSVSSRLSWPRSMPSAYTWLSRMRQGRSSVRRPPE